eukprot:jgi/Astpho2/1294/e_gw1.00024.25.1_t
MALLCLQLCGREIVSSVLDGYNGTIMAYGQTGSGKTYTMTGEQCPMQGIMPRAISQVFRELKRNAPQFNVGVSYVEIYNEGFRDLLQPETKIKSSMSLPLMGTLFLASSCTSSGMQRLRACLTLMQGQRNRHVAGHGLNDRSSRSHTIFTLWVQTCNAEGQSFSSKLNLVDLAGSERYTKTGAEGSVAKEAMHINKSLSFLEQASSGLHATPPCPERHMCHVPYRSSKLTHFLKDSIGGNCQTLLVSCIWSDECQLSETLSTCRFAQRMMQVRVMKRRSSCGSRCKRCRQLPSRPSSRQRSRHSRQPTRQRSRRSSGQPSHLRPGM